MPYSHETFKYNYERTIGDDSETIPLEVEYYFIPAIPKVMFYSNGDYGHDGEPAEIEIVSIKYIATGKEVEQSIFDIIYKDVVKEAWRLEKQLNG